MDHLRVFECSAQKEKTWQSSLNPSLLSSPHSAVVQVSIEARKQMDHPYPHFLRNIQIHCSLELQPSRISKFYSHREGPYSYSWKCILDTSAFTFKTLLSRHYDKGVSRHEIGTAAQKSQRDSFENYAKQQGCPLWPLGLRLLSVG